MSLIHIPIRERTITDEVNRIRGILARVIEFSDSRLSRIRDVVREQGRSAIVAEFGDDAATLLVVYTKLKEAIEAATDIAIEELP